MAKTHPAQTAARMVDAARYDSLGEKCGVFWNDRTPPGWVEIQRDDEYANGATKRGFSDEDAARLVCGVAGVPEGCAVWVAWGTPRGIVKSEANETWLLTRVGANTPRDAVAAVPAVVAWIAGLIDDKQLELANREGT